MSKLSEWFYYDETSRTCLRWKQNRYCGVPQRILVAAGDEAGSLMHNKYYETNLDEKGYRVHRLIWELFYGEIPTGYIIDHIDGDGLNNKIENLRLVTHRTNARNSAKRSHNKTGFTGVVKSCKIENGKEYWYYIAIWRTIDGKQRRANYSINKLGDSTAFLLAFSHRQGAMEDLKISGAGYTERHGL